MVAERLSRCAHCETPVSCKSFGVQQLLINVGEQNQSIKINVLQRKSFEITEYKILNTDSKIFRFRILPALRTSVVYIVIN